jgi:hypothetical protein
MRILGRWTGLLVATVIALTVPLTAAAQDDSDGIDPPRIELPDLEGLAWYRSTDLAGSEMPASLGEDEVAAWQALSDGAGASLDDLAYTFDLAFDPATLPRIGAMATVQVAGADTDALHAAVVQDIIDQAVALGAEPPEAQATTLGDKAVTVLVLPDVMGYETATVYTNEDAAYVMLMPAGLVAEALDALP